MSVLTAAAGSADPAETATMVMTPTGAISAPGPTTRRLRVDGSAARCPWAKELLPDRSLVTLPGPDEWGRVAPTTGPVAPKAATFGALSRLSLLASPPSRGCFRASDREEP